MTLTGGIGSGKTTVANLFGQLGVPLIDADIIARQVVEPGAPALAAMVTHFGAEILTIDGTLNRRTLRSRIFADDQERHWLEQLLHPLIRSEMLRQAAEVDYPYALMIVPLLVENDLVGLGDRVLVIDVDEELQIERTCRRDNLTRSEAIAILAVQATRAERLAVADEVLRNQDCSDVELRQEVERLHHYYLRLAENR